METILWTIWGIGAGVLGALLVFTDGMMGGRSSNPILLIIFAALWPLMLALFVCVSAFDAVCKVFAPSEKKGG